MKSDSLAKQLAAADATAAPLTGLLAGTPELADLLAKSAAAAQRAEQGGGEIRWAGAERGAQVGLAPRAAAAPPTAIWAAAAATYNPRTRCCAATAASRTFWRPARRPTWS